MHKDLKTILIKEAEINQKCKELGQEITKYYAAKEEAPLLVALLKGSVPFLAKLISKINLDIEYDFMDVSSYEGTESVGDVKINKDLDRSVRNKSILLVEDIVDTGKTISEVKRLLLNKGAKEVKVVTLLDKPSRREKEINAEFVGFTIPNEFVVGFGLDYNEKYRNLPYIGILKEELY